MDAAEMISNDIASDGEVGGEAVADEVVADEEIVDEKTVNAGAVEQAVTEEVQKKGGKVDDARNGGGEKNWPGWPGECVFRILVPAPRVGGIIGKRGEVIKKMCEESKARIKILDGPHTLAHNSPERAVVC